MEENSKTKMMRNVLLICAILCFLLFIISFSGLLVGNYNWFSIIFPLVLTMAALHYRSHLKDKSTGNDNDSSDN